jgi:hypothetical protein
MSRRISLVICLLAILAFAAPAFAEEKRRSDPKVINGVDPTFFVTRTELKNIYDHGPNGTRVNTTVIRGDYTIKQVFKFRVDVPLVYADQPGSDGEYGLGDLELRLAGLLAQTDYMRVAAGLDLGFDTASAQLLGSGKYTIRPLFATVFYPTDWFTIVIPFVKYQRSYVGDDARPDVNNLEFETDFQFDLPARWWTELQSKVRIDFDDSNRVGWSMEAEVGRMLTKHIGLWIHPGVGMAGKKPYDFSIEAGFRYLIRL